MEGAHCAIGIFAGAAEDDILGSEPFGGFSAPNAVKEGSLWDNGGAIVRFRGWVDDDNDDDKRSEVGGACGGNIGVNERPWSILGFSFAKSPPPFIPKNGVKSISGAVGLFSDPCTGHLAI